MSYLKNKKLFTTAGLGAALLIAVYLSLFANFETIVPKGSDLANYIIVVIALRALFIVSLIWFFYERSLRLIDKYNNSEHVTATYAGKKIKIITWYLVFEILMLVTFL